MFRNLFIGSVWGSPSHDPNLVITYNINVSVSRRGCVRRSTVRCKPGIPTLSTGLVPPRFGESGWISFPFIDRKGKKSCLLPQVLRERNHLNKRGKKTRWTGERTSEGNRTPRFKNRVEPVVGHRTSYEVKSRTFVGNGTSYRNELLTRTTKRIFSGKTDPSFSGDLLWKFRTRVGCPCGSTGGSSCWFGEY